MNKTFTAFGVVGILLLVAALFVVGPWVTILAVNHLFGTAIQLTFWNWLSVVWLQIIVTATTSKS